jgi:hypothetical protein
VSQATAKEYVRAQRDGRADLLFADQAVHRLYCKFLPLLVHTCMLWQLQPRVLRLLCTYTFVHLALFRTFASGFTTYSAVCSVLHNNHSCCVHIACHYCQIHAACASNSTACSLHKRMSCIINIPILKYLSSGLAVVHQAISLLLSYATQVAHHT